jgi:acid stress-induced BolA-like protein IbaG/YrbA
MLDSISKSNKLDVSCCVEVKMVSPKQVEEMIQAKLPDAQVFVRDLTGGGDHLEAVVVSAEFEGETRVKQHQIVYSALQEAMASEAIHALALKTYTPQAWQAAGQPV